MIYNIIIRIIRRNNNKIYSDRVKHVYNIMEKKKILNSRTFAGGIGNSRYKGITV